jgi:hypothetical protein
MAHALQLSMAALHEHALHLLQRNDLAALDFCGGSPSVTA